jgi:hypothetical protein
VLCCGCGEIGNLTGALTPGMSTSTAGLGTTSIYPSWYLPSVGLVQGLAILLAIAVGVLLALRPSTEYFTAMSAKAAPPQGPIAPGYPGYPPQQPPGGYPGGGYPGY